MTKITAYAALTLPAGSDVIPVVDVSDTLMAAFGPPRRSPSRTWPRWTG